MSVGVWMPQDDFDALAEKAKRVDALRAELEQAEKERDENEQMGNEWGDESVAWMRRANAAETRLAKVPALVEAAKQVTTAADAMENGGLGVPAAKRAHLAMVKAEGELLLAEALVEWERE